MNPRLIAFWAGLLLTAGLGAEERMKGNVQAGATPADFIHSPDPGRHQPSWPDEPAPAEHPQADPVPIRAAPKPAARAPNEQRLWDLWRQGRIRTLERTLRDYRRAYPDWRPPRKLVSLLSEHRRNIRLKARVARAGAGASICADPDSVWSSAERHQSRDESVQAETIYTRMVTDCPLPIARATLQKASVRSDDDAFRRLTDSAAQRTDGQRLAALIDDLDYERGKRALLTAREMGDWPNAAEFATRLTPRFIARRDVDILGMAGWDAHQRQRDAEAMRYWRLALDLQPQREDARYGLALTLRRQGDLHAARTLLGPEPESPRLRQLLGEIMLDQGWEALDAGAAESALGLSSEARRWLRDSEDADLLQAWGLYRRGEFAAAADTFAALYRKHPTRQNADGWVLSLAAFAPRRLQTLPDSDREPLKSALTQRNAAELYARKHFLAARAARAAAFPQLEHIDGPFVGGAFLLRHRSGQSGLGRLTIMERPLVEGGWVSGGTDRFGVKAAALDLDSGTLSRNFVRSLDDVGLAFSHQPFSAIHDAALIEFSWARDGWVTPYATLGTTPLNGPVSPLPTYRLGLIQESAWGRWQAEAFGQPVRESLLAYVGQRNPFSGNSWGRVVKNGARMSAYTRLGDRWGSSTEALGSYLTGHNVDDNWMAGASIGIGYDLKLAGFDYFTLGPTVAFQHYDRNLNHFTPGHDGGYFSPDHLVNAGLGLNFLTEESRVAIAKGRLTLGYQNFRAPSESFSLRNADGVNVILPYEADRYSDVFFDFELKGAWLFAPNWMLAGGAAARQTSGYEDYSVGLMLRYVPEARKAIFSADIPDSLFQALY